MWTEVNVAVERRHRESSCGDETVLNIIVVVTQIYICGKIV